MAISETKYTVYRWYFDSFKKEWGSRCARRREDI